MAHYECTTYSKYILLDEEDVLEQQMLQTAGELENIPVNCWVEIEFHESELLVPREVWTLVDKYHKSLRAKRPVKGAQWLSEADWF